MATKPFSYNKVKVLKQYTLEKKAAVDFRQQKMTNWLQNEELYNGSIQQTLITKSNLHVPQVFDGVNSWVGRLGKMPKVSFETKPEGDMNASELMEQMWRYDSKRSKLPSLYTMSKTECGIYGRTIFKLIPRDDGAKWKVVDTMSFLISPIAPLPRFALYCGDQFIYKTIEQLDEEAEDFDYDQKELARLREDMKKTDSTTSNITNSEQSIKNQRLAYQGFANTPNLGSKVADITEWYTHIANGRGRFKKVVLTVANDKYLLRCLPVKDVGLPRFPYASYGAFPRAVTYWNPSPADVLRDPNLAEDVILNQNIDNNTYRNFGMLFVDSASGFKQSSLIPRPLGVTPITVPEGRTIKDMLFQYTPASIGESVSVFDKVKSLGETAACVTAGPVPQTKGGKVQQSVTKLVELQTLLEEKLDQTRQSVLDCFEDMADLYAETIKMNLDEPQMLKIMGARGLTIDGVTKKNFEGVKFIASATPAEEASANKAVEADMALKTYNVFKDDPTIQNQKFLRERTLRKLGMKDAEIDRLLSPDNQSKPEPIDMPAAPEQPKAPISPAVPQKGIVPGLPSKAAISNVQKGVKAATKGVKA